MSDYLGWMMLASFAVGLLCGAALCDAVYRHRWRDLSVFFEERARRVEPS